MKGDRHFVIGGVRWLWRYSRLVGKSVGWCYFADRKVLISEKLKGRRKLDTEIHEFLHAALPSLSEEAVTTTASDLAVVLWQLGYRQEGKNGKGKAG